MASANPVLVGSANSHDPIGGQWPTLLQTQTTTTLSSPLSSHSISPYLSPYYSTSPLSASPRPNGLEPLPAQSRQYARLSASSNNGLDGSLRQPASALLRHDSVQSWKENVERADIDAYARRHRHHSARSSTAHGSRGSLEASTRHSRHGSKTAMSSHLEDVQRPAQVLEETGSSHRGLHLDARHSASVDGNHPYRLPPPPPPPPPFHKTPSPESLTVRTVRTYDFEAASRHEAPERKLRTETLPALIHIALFAFLLSFAIAIYAIFIILAVVIVSPLRLCFSHTIPFSHTIISYLIPPLNLQRRCISAKPLLPPKANKLPKSQTEDSVTAHASQSEALAPPPCRTMPLITTHLLSPFLSLPLAVCAWITALAWLPSAMMWSEETSGVSDDERRMAETLVDFWFWWLDWCRSEVPVVEVEEVRGRSRVKSTR